MVTTCIVWFPPHNALQVREQLQLAAPPPIMAKVWDHKRVILFDNWIWIIMNIGKHKSENLVENLHFFLDRRTRRLAWWHPLPQRVVPDWICVFDGSLCLSLLHIILLQDWAWGWMVPTWRDQVAVAEELLVDRKSCRTNCRSCHRTLKHRRPTDQR